MTENGGSTARVADRYRLERRIGRGGAGAVWRAHDENLDRKVAIKQIAIASESEASSRTRAMREARAAARLHVPNVVQVYDVIEEAGSVYLIMELVEAPNLSALVRRKGPLAPRDAAALGLQMLDALEAAHRAGIVHRDVKPSNVLIQHDTARLTDFGIARLSDDPTLTATGVVMGTPAYIAPEYAQGSEIGPAVDYYGLGATLYYAVEGRSPFSADGSLSTVMAVINSPPRPLTKAGPLTGLLSALLAKDPKARPSPDEIRAELHEVAGQGGPPVTSIRRAPWVGSVAGAGAGAITGDVDAGPDTAGAPGDDDAVADDDVTPRTGVPSAAADAGMGVAEDEAVPETDVADEDVTPETGAPADPDVAPGADVPADADVAPEADVPADADVALEADVPAEEDVTPATGASADADVAPEPGTPAEVVEEDAAADTGVAVATGGAEGARVDIDDDEGAAAADAGDRTHAGNGAGRAGDEASGEADTRRKTAAPLSTTLERSRTTGRAAPGDREPDRRPSKRRLAILASVLGLLVVAAIGMNSFFGGRQDASDDASQPAVAAPPSETRSAAGADGGDAGAAAAPPAEASPSERSESSESAEEDGGGEGDGDEGGDSEGDGVLPPTDAEIPEDWVEYAPSGGPYRLWHPPGWQVVPGDGNLTDIRDPETGTYLRLDWVNDRRNPVRAWERTEEGFSRRYGDYERIGLNRTTFKGDRAALWEYRYRAGGAELHAYNLGVNKGEYGFALNLQARESNWDQAQELWPHFLSGYEFTGP